MTKQCDGFFRLVALHLRRDRWLLPVWILAFAGIASFSAAATAGLYPDLQSRVTAAEAVNAVPSLVALFGPVLDPTSLGELSLIKLTAWGAAFVAIVMIFFTVRHTRGDEESGRIELVMSRRVGRLAPLASAYAVVFTASVLLGGLTAVGLLLAGLPASGSLAFGVGWAVVGIVFSALAGVFAQLTVSARAAIGASLVAVAIAYVFRAFGDVSDASWLSWCSPFGWNEALRAYSGTRWAVIVIPVFVAFFFVLLAFVLRDHRDLGAGYGRVRSGASHGRIRTVWGLAFRLQAKTLLVWMLAFLIFGAFIGSLANSMTGLLSSANAERFFEAIGGRESVVNMTLSAYVAIMGIIAAGYAIAACFRARTEETHGEAELLLATRTSRWSFLASHAVFAFLGSVLLMFSAGVGLAISASLTLSDASYVPKILAAALLQTPAAWLFAALALLLFGWMPRGMAAAWAALAVALVLTEFGALWQAPQWLVDLSPFSHTPRIPLEIDNGVLLTALLSVAIGVAGFIGWKRRDLSA